MAKVQMTPKRFAEIKRTGKASLQEIRHMCAIVLSKARRHADTCDGSFAPKK